MMCQARVSLCFTGTLRGITWITRNLDKEGRIQERFHKEAGFKICLEARGRVCVAPGNRIRYGRSEIHRAVTSGESKGGA